MNLLQCGQANVAAIRLALLGAAQASWIRSPS